MEGDGAEGGGFGWWGGDDVPKPLKLAEVSIVLINDLKNDLGGIYLFLDGHSLFI